MAISLVGTASGGNTNGADVTIDLSSLGMAENDIVLVMGGHGNVSGSAAAAVSTSGYTELAVNSTAGSYSFVSEYKRMSGSPDTSVTGVGGGDAGNAVGYVVMVFRGVSTTTAIDATTVTATGSSGDPNSAPIINVTDGAAVISCFGKNLDSTFEPDGEPNGYVPADPDYLFVSRTDTEPFMAGAAWKAISGTAGDNPGSWSIDASFSGGWAAHTIALRPAAEGVNMDGAGSFTGTGTASFGSNPIDAKAVSFTGTGTASFVGNSLATQGAFAMTGTATAGFDASTDVPFAMTGTATVTWIGARSRLSAVRNVIETGNITVNIT